MVRSAQQSRLDADLDGVSVHADIGPGSSSSDDHADTRRAPGHVSTFVRIAVGAVLVMLAALVVYPFPLVAVGVAIWWLARDLARPHTTGRRYPGGTGIAALVLIGVAGALVTSIVVGLETHFDCGGTFGGYGGTGSADADSACVEARQWRPGFAVAVVAATTVLAGVVLRRSIDSLLVERGGPAGVRPLVHPVLIAVGTMVALLGVWTLGVLLYVLP